jgi:hypothetical protein
MCLGFEAVDGETTNLGSVRVGVRVCDINYA